MMVAGLELVGSLSELINKRGRSVIQIFERMPLAMIINPGHQDLSGFSSRNVPLGLGSVLIECGYKAKNPGRSGRCKSIVIPRDFQSRKHTKYSLVLKRLLLRSPDSIAIPRRI
jgi:hypothetical protein